jgi:hypothetical protein
MSRSIGYIRVIVLWAMGVTLLLASATTTVAEANSKVVQLQQKMADISLLKQQLKDHSQKAELVLNALMAQKEELISEIYVLVKSLKITTLDQAQQNLRIHNNIELLRSLMAYTDEFEVKIRFYQTGHDKLAYLHQLTADDVKMAATLNDFEIDALTTQISLVINKYLPEAHTIQIDPQRIEPVSPQKVWQSMVHTSN